MKNLANVGTAFRKKVMYVRMHEGSLGWRRAHDNARIDGWADEVIAETWETDSGSA